MKPQKGARAVAAAALLGALLMIAARAHADGAHPQDVPKVLIVGVAPTSSDVPPLVPKRAAELIAKDLAAQPDLLLLSIVDDAGDAATAAPPPPPADRMDEAKGALTAAKNALDGKDYKRAAERAQNAIDAFEASAAVLPEAGVNLLIDAYVDLGIALALSGKETDARAAFRQAMAFEPTSPPALAPYGKQVAKLWTTAGKEYDGVKRASVKITVTPAEAAAVVYIDGANHGDAPVDAPELGAGTHVLRVVAEGYRPFGQRVLLAAGAMQTVAVTLEPTVAAAGKPDAVRAALRGELKKRAATGLVDASAKPIAARLAERTAATHLVLGMISPSGKGYELRVFLFRASDKLLVELDALPVDAELLQLEPVTLAASRGIVASIHDFPTERDITTTLHKTVDPTKDPGRGKLIGDGKQRTHRGDGPIDQPASPLYKKWWFWGGVGAAIVGGVVLGVALSGGAASGYDGSVTLP